MSRLSGSIGDPAKGMHCMTNQMWVVAVPVMIWVGVFAYLLLLDRKLAAVEAALANDDR